VKNSGVRQSVATFRRAAFHVLVKKDERGGDDGRRPRREGVVREKEIEGRKRGKQS